MDLAARIAEMIDKLNALDLNNDPIPKNLGSLMGACGKVIREKAVLDKWNNSGPSRTTSGVDPCEASTSSARTGRVVTQQPAAAVTQQPAVVASQPVDSSQPPQAQLVSQVVMDPNKCQTVVRGRQCMNGICRNSTTKQPDGRHCHNHLH